MLPDANALVREVDCHLREVESLIERCVPAVEEAKKKVDGLELMRRACEAFGSTDSIVILSQHAGPMRERVAKLEGKLRSALQRLAGAVVVETDTLDITNEPMAAPADVPEKSATNGIHAEPAEIAPPSRATIVYKPPPPIRAAAVAPAIAPPDPEDLEKIHELEEECERQFSKLAFVGDEERHALLTICAAKGRRLRVRLRDSYAVDRRLGDLIRKIVDMKRRYRLGWIDGCERSFDVPDWDAYVERCEDHFRELKIREQARQEEARVARERAGQLATEVERRGRELRHYLETDEGHSAAEPEKLRAVLMSYLSVDGSLDADLLEKLRAHKNLFTGIAFRRVRKELERPGIVNSSDSEHGGEIIRIRDRVLSKTRGARAVVFGPYVSDDVRRRVELILGLERLAWVEANALDDASWEELDRQVARGEIQFIIRAMCYLSESSGAALLEMVKKGSVTMLDLDRPEDPQHVLFAFDRILFTAVMPNLP
ncbi:MAG: hypothetical protein ACKVS6_13430 [Planctomycetota bacterium]